METKNKLFYIFPFLPGVLITGVICNTLKGDTNRYEIRFNSQADNGSVGNIQSGNEVTNDFDDKTPINNSNNGREESLHTVNNFLKAAMEPVGTTLYIYGGGWNEDDSAAGVEAVSYGVSPRWYEFFKENDSSYNYQENMYQIHDGLDCTGYVGYATYQIFGDSYSDNGYVYPSKDVVAKYASMFDSTFIYKNSITRYYPGDIMGTDGHVFIVIGRCLDGSLLFVHASPPVASICGTKKPDGSPDSEAIRLADKYMSKYFPEAYQRYDTCIRDIDFLTDYNQMHWNRNILKDPDGYDEMTPEEILKDLFENGIVN